MTADPFPLFHLSPLDFAVTDPAKLSSAQLALAPYSAEWDEAAEKKVIRTWRQRREKNRARMGTVGIGIFASPDERAREQWPLFELIDLAWEIKGELESLTSAQLAVVAFHPDSTKELVADAEDIWFARRERDFALGLSLPPFPPQGAVTTTPAASAPPSAPTPAAPAAPNSAGVPIAAPPPAARANVNGLSSHAWLDADADSKPQINPGAVIAPKRLTLVDYRRGKEMEAREAAQSDESRRKEAAERKQREDDEERRESDKHRESARLAAEVQLAADERARRAKTPTYERDERDRARDRDNRRDRDERRDRDRYDDRDREQERERDSSENKRNRPDEHDERSPARRRRSSVTSSSREGRTRDRTPTHDRERSTRAHSPSQRDFGFVPADEGRVSRFAGRPINIDDGISPDLQEALNVLYIHNMPRRAGVEQIREMLLATHQIAPLGIKITASKEKMDRSHVFIAYLLAEDARLVVDRVGGHVFLGEVLGAEMARSPPSGSPAWRWFQIDSSFREEWKAGRVRLPQAGFGDGQPTTYPTRMKASLPPQMLPPDQRRTSTASASVGSQDGNVLIPSALSDSLSQIFMSNCPEFVSVDEIRMFLNDHPGLVGIALGSSNNKYHNSSVWAAFATKNERDKALDRLDGTRFPRMNIRLYLEKGERGKSKKDWRWNDMAKDFRDKHRPTPGGRLASPRPSSSTLERISVEPHHPESSSSRTPSSSSAPPPRGSLSGSATRPSEPEPSEHPAKRLKSSTGSISSAIDAPLPSPALPDRLRPDPGHISQPPAAARPASLPSKPMFSLADDEGYTPENAGGLGFSLRLSTPAGKVHSSRQPLLPDAPADLSETLAALVAFTPVKTAAASMSPSIASQPPNGPRNGSAYERPSAASLSSIPGVAADDMNQVRDWTTWPPATGVPMFTTAKGTHTDLSVPGAPLLSPKSKPAASRLPGTTPTGPKNLLIKGVGGPKSSTVVDAAPAAKFNEGINGGAPAAHLSAKEAARARDQARMAKIKSEGGDVVMLD